MDALAKDVEAETNQARTEGTERSDKSSAFDSLDARSGIDYALRTMQQSQVQFSLMADAKSNIMITVCSIVVSASLTQIHRPEFRAPLIVLDAFTIVALIAALLCVLPSRRRPESSNGEIDRSAETFNPLFFMHFRHLSLGQFQEELARAFATNGELYRSLSRDIYETGRVLADSKFRLLRISYISFMIGLVASLTIWVVDLYRSGEYF